MEKEILALRIKMVNDLIHLGLSSVDNLQTVFIEEKVHGYSFFVKLDYDESKNWFTLFVRVPLENTEKLSCQFNTLKLWKESFRTIKKYHRLWKEAK